MDNKFPEEVYQILELLYGLTNSGLKPSQITKIRREIIFFLYEGGEPEQWCFKRPHSKAARKLHREACKNGRKFSNRNYPVTYDHAIPLDTLKEGLGKAVTDSKLEMIKFLESHIKGVVILKEENKKLNSHGLRSRMPANYNPCDIDMMARYKEAKIVFEKEDQDKLERQKN